MVYIRKANARAGERKFTTKAINTPKETPQKRQEAKFGKIGKRTYTKLPFAYLM